MNESPSRKQAIERGLKSADVTSTERHIRRSFKIRRKTKRFMMEHVDELFGDFGDICEQAANDSKCSSETAKRWINQYSQPNEMFRIDESDAGSIIRYRGDIEGKWVVSH